MIMIVKMLMRIIMITFANDNDRGNNENTFDTNNVRPTLSLTWACLRTSTEYLPDTPPVHSASTRSLAKREVVEVAREGATSSKEVLIGSGIYKFLCETETGGFILLPIFSFFCFLYSLKTCLSSVEMKGN